jgi:hypothetical protein
MQQQNPTVNTGAIEIEGCPFVVVCLLINLKEPIRTGLDGDLHLSHFPRVGVQLREAADALGLIWQDTGLGLVLGDGGAFDGAADEVIVQTVGQVAAIEPVGPFPEITHQVLGADAVMGADEPGFDFAERLPFLFFGAGTFVDGDDPAFVGAGRCCVRDCSDRRR